MAGAPKTGGIEPREFLIVMFVPLEGFTDLGLKKSGTIKEYPDSISPENAAFIERNFDKLLSMLEPLKGGAKRDTNERI